LRRSGEPGRFHGESRRNTTCRICLFYWEFSPSYAVLRKPTIGLRPLTSHLQQPGPGGEADARHSGLYGRRASWEHGDWRPRQEPGQYRPQPRQARCRWRCGSSLTEPCPVSPGEEHDHRDTEWGLSAGFAVQWLEQLPGPSCEFLTGVKETGTDKAMPGGPTRAATPTRSLLPAVVQMCRTFQKWPVNRAVRPCRAACPARFFRGRGTGSLRGRHGRRRNAAPRGWRKRRRSRARRRSRVRT